jgi:hypothetical protein
MGNLYEHITEVISHIVQCCPDQALERFEEISYLLKHKDTIAIENYLKMHESNRHCTHSDERAKLTA